MKLLGRAIAALTLLAALVLLAGGCTTAPQPVPTRAAGQPAALATAPVATASPAWTAGGSAAAPATLVASPAVPAGWKAYSHAVYGVSLQHPPDWQKQQGYDERYAGKDGFFQVGAMGGETLSIDQAAASDANHKLQPYGSQPAIERADVQGQEARFIFPSNDQPAEEKGLAALIVLAPRPIEVSGARYRFLIVWADKGHIREIAKTLRFTAAATPPTVAAKPSTAAPAPRVSGPGSVPATPQYDPVPLKADAALEREVRALLGAGVASYGVAVKRLADGRGIVIDPDRQFYAASLFKVLVLYEVFKQRQLRLLSFEEKLAITGRYLEFQLLEPPWPEGAEVPIGELVEAMIVKSDNVAAMLLHDKVGGWNIIQDMRAVGLARTDLSGDDMPTSAGDMALWLEMIARGKAVDQQSSQEMIDLLSRQSVRDRLPALLPPGTKVANKTGNWEKATHDVGVVYAPKGAYVIAVLSDRAWESRPIAQLSRLVYDYFERNPPPASPAPIATPLPAARPTATVAPPVVASPTPATMVVKVYFSRVVTNNVELVPVERVVPRAATVGRAALEALLKGPTPQEKARGLTSAIPERAQLLTLKIVDGVAYADFDEALQFQVGGSVRVMAIRQSITRTLLQFSTVQRVVISIGGRTEDILQP